MNRHLKVVALSASLAFASPALADATYVAQLNGVVTSGYSYIDDRSGCQCLDVSDLTGSPVAIYIKTIKFDHFIDFNGVVHSDYVDVSSTFTISNFTFHINADNIVDPFFITSASYVGDNVSAAISAAFFDTGGASSAAFALTFDEAGSTQRPLSGSGQTYVSHSLNYPVQDIRFGFNLIGGSVQAISSTVPEPASWMLMIAGLGLVGGALRRRKEEPSSRLLSYQSNLARTATINECLDQSALMSPLVNN